MSNWKIIVPEATTNLVTNPSFETNTTGWAADGTNTIAQSSTESLFGSYSLLCTYQNDLDLARYTITLTAAAHAFGCWVYLSSNWDGGAVRLSVENFTSVVTNTATTTTTTTGSWQYLEILFTPDAGDLAGDLVIETASAPTAGRTIYVDAVQCEAKAYSTTYCDGDQGGCEWSGTFHGSTSSRGVLSRAGGRVKDLDDDYGFPVQRMIGAGMPTLENIVTERAFSPGSDYQRFVVPERTLTLVSTVIGSTLADYHDKRQELIKILAPDGTPTEDPVLLRYTGATITKEIRVRYAGGLTLTGPEGYAEEVGLQFIAAEQPLFQIIGEKSEALTSSENHTFYLIAARENGVWSRLNDQVDTGGDIQAIEIDQAGNVYVGGDFTNLDGIANADYVAMWNGSAWSALSTGMDAQVKALKVLPNGNLLAGGSFTTAGGVTCNNIALWNGSAWSALGPPTTGGTVNAIEIDYNGDYYVAGQFTAFDGANQDNIAKYDVSATSWGALSTGIVGTVNDLTLDLGGNLIIGGSFTTAGGAAAEGIALWNGSAFTALSTDTDAAIFTVYNDVNNLLYVGGAFTTIGGSAIDYIATWNGVAFSPLESPNGRIDVINKWQGNIIAGGIHTLIGDLSAASYCAIWNGSSWAFLDQTFNSNLTINAIATYETTLSNKLYLGLNAPGDTAGGTSVVSITPGGTAKIYPKMTIKRSGGTTAFIQNIGNETTETYLWLSYDLLDGETLTIDFDPSNINAQSNFRGAVWPFLPNSDIANFYLLPNVANTITFYVSETGSPTITAFMKWKDSYWSID